MIKFLSLLFGIILVIGLMGCEIKTPEIHGIVLDAETKQPVEGAWISATVGIKTKTVAGDVGQMISLDPPHTRTNKEGRFVISVKKIKKSPFPISFGSEIDSFGIGASTIDDKIGGLTLSGDQLKDFLNKDKFRIEIKIKYTERTEAEYFSHLQSLYNYCLTGRFGIEVPAVEGGCDEWELEYVITKHERYLNIYSKIIEREVNTVIFNNLSNLYEKKGHIDKAIEILKQSLNLIERRDLLKFDIWRKNKESIEKKISKLQKKKEGIKNEKSI